MTLVIRFDPPSDTPSTYMLSVDENPAPGTGVTVNNGSYRFVRFDLFHHSRDDYFDSPNPLSPTLDPDSGFSGPLTIGTVFGLDHTLCSRDGIAQLGFLGIGVASKAIPFGPYTAWIAQYRLEVVGPSLLEAPIPARYLLPVEHPSGIRISRWTRLWTITVLKQIGQPLGLMALGDLSVVAQVILALWDFDWANSRSTAIIGAIGTALNKVAIALGNPDAANPAVKLLVEGWIAQKGATMGADAARAWVSRIRQRLLFLTSAFAWTGIIDAIITELSLTAVLPVYNAVIETPLLRPAISVGPSVPLVATVTLPLDMDVSVQWADYPDGANGSEAPNIRALGSQAGAILANASIRNGGIELTDVFQRIDGGLQSVDLDFRFEEIGLDEALVPQAAALLKPEGWDPQRGRRNVAVEIEDPWQLFVSQHPGFTGLRVTVTPTTDSPYWPYDRQGILEVGVRNIPGLVELEFAPEEELYVGETTGPVFSVTLPDGTRFASDERFTANVTAIGGGIGLAIRDITVDAPRRWDDELEPRLLPFDIIVEQRAEPAERFPCLRFHPPGIGQLLDVGESANTYDSLGTYIQARNTGRAPIRIRLEPRAGSENIDGRPTAESAITVLERVLDLELKSDDDPDQDGSLLLADRSLDGDIVGTFHIEISSGADLLYVSHERAYMEGTCMGNWLLIKKLLVEDANGDQTQLPFMISIELRRPAGTAHDVAAFTLRHQDFAPGTGTFAVHGSLDNVVRAVRHGEATLRVELLSNPELDDAALPSYSFPAARELRVVVPAPLEAELLTWTNEDFQMSLSGQAGGGVVPFQELIRSSGTLRGRAKHHRAHGAGEHITVRLRSADGSERTIDLLSPEAHVHWLGDAWSAPVSGLKIGSTTVDLFASNASTTLEGLLPARDSATLRGVPPRDVDIEQPDHTVETSVVNVQVQARYSRALKLEIIDDRGGVLAQRGLSYDSRSDNYAVSLPQVVGTHHLIARATNDFDHVDSEAAVFEAKAPEFEDGPSIEAPEGARTDPNDSHFFGNNVERVHVTGNLRFANSATFSFNLTGETGFVTLDRQPDERADFDITMNLTAGATPFDSPSHVLTISAANDFKTITRTAPAVRRRAWVFESPFGIAITLQCLSTEPADFLEVVVYDTAGNSIMYDVTSPLDVGKGPGWDTTPSTLFTSLVTWEGKRHGGNDGTQRIPTTMPSRVSISGVVVDPNFAPWHPFLKIPFNDVDTNASSGMVDQATGVTVWSDAVLKSIAGGTYPIIVIQF